MTPPDAFPCTVYYFSGREVEVSSQADLDALRPGWARRRMGPFPQAPDFMPWLYGPSAYDPEMGALPQFRVDRLGFPVAPGEAPPRIVWTPEPFVDFLRARRPGEVFLVQNTRWTPVQMDYDKLLFCPPTVWTHKHLPSGRHFMSADYCDEAARAYETDDMSIFSPARSQEDAAALGPQGKAAHYPSASTRGRREGTTAVSEDVWYTRYEQARDSKGGREPTIQELAQIFHVTARTISRYKVKWGIRNPTG